MANPWEPEDHQPPNPREYEAVRVRLLSAFPELKDVVLASERPYLEGNEHELSVYVLVEGPVWNLLLRSVKRRDDERVAAIADFIRWLRDSDWENLPTLAEIGFLSRIPRHRRIRTALRRTGFDDLATP